MKNMKKKKIVFISVATGRVGKALFHSFSNIGLNLIMTDVDEKKLISLKKKLPINIKIKFFITNLIYLISIPD